MGLLHKTYFHAAKPLLLQRSAAQVCRVGVAAPCVLMDNWFEARLT